MMRLKNGEDKPMASRESAPDIMIVDCRYISGIPLALSFVLEGQTQLRTPRGNIDLNQAHVLSIWIPTTGIGFTHLAVGEPPTSSSLSRIVSVS